MSKQPTTIRLDPALYREAMRIARKTGLTFSGVIHLLLRAFVQGTVHIGVIQYPEDYLESLEKESAELSRLYRKGKAKGYASAKELLGDILAQ